mmetsp:Transcript_19432/g.45442  ORF Transcript_19432/g.45442 Transcript_19432/m.45442 type:complete len:210 (-) Transcript_19432:74-703(-)
MHLLRRRTVGWARGNTIYKWYSFSCSRKHSRKRFSQFRIQRCTTIWRKWGSRSCCKYLSCFIPIGRFTVCLHSILFGTVRVILIFICIILALTTVLPLRNTFVPISALGRFFKRDCCQKRLEILNQLIFRLQSQNKIRQLQSFLDILRAKTNQKFGFELSQCGHGRCHLCWRSWLGFCWRGHCRHLWLGTCLGYGLHRRFPFGLCHTRF